MYSKSLSVLCFCLLANLIYGQDTRLKFISLEANMNFIGGQSMVYENIRDDASGYGYGETTKNLRAVANMGSVGARIELRSLNNKFGLSSGLHYSQLNSSIDKGILWTLSNFFYFMVNESATTVEYLKVRSINQTSDYIGVPINLTWYPFKEHLFTIYFKGGFEFNYRLATKTKVVFVDRTMDRFSENILENFDEPQKLVSVFNASGGVKVGKESRATFLFEMGPTAFLNKRSSGILNAEAGFAIRGGVQIPF